MSRGNPTPKAPIDINLTIGDVMDYITAEMKEEYARRRAYSQECNAKWETFRGEPIFDLCEQGGSGAAIVIPLGKYEVEIPLKQVSLLQKCIENDPAILIKFLALALGEKEDIKPKRSSNLKRRRNIGSPNVIELKRPNSLPKSSFDDYDFLDDIPLDKC